MQRQVLSRTEFYIYGDIDMPKGFEILTKKNLPGDILQSTNSTLKNFHSQELGIC